MSIMFSTSSSVFSTTEPSALRTVSRMCILYRVPPFASVAIYLFMLAAVKLFTDWPIAALIVSPEVHLVWLFVASGFCHLIISSLYDGDAIVGAFSLISIPVFELRPNASMYSSSIVIPLRLNWFLGSPPRRLPTL